MLDTKDPVTQGGFTQVPNFILKNPDLSVGAKVVYSMFLSYAWHNDSLLSRPGQDRMAKDMGDERLTCNDFIKELEAAGLIEIMRRGQGKTNLYKLEQKTPCDTSSIGIARKG